MVEVDQAFPTIKADEPKYPRIGVPTVTKPPKEMPFCEALQLTLEGKKISRIGWESNAIFGQMVNNELMLFIRGEFHSWTLVPGDITATDWIVLPE